MGCPCRIDIPLRHQKIENQSQSGDCPRLVLDILPVIGQDSPAPISVGHEIVRLGGETLNQQPILWDTMDMTICMLI